MSNMSHDFMSHMNHILNGNTVKQMDPESGAAVFDNVKFEQAGAEARGLLRNGEGEEESTCVDGIFDVTVEVT